MNLHTSALLAFIGTLLLTILLALDFVNALIGLTHDIVPLMTVVREFIYLLAGATLTFFLYKFRADHA